MRRSRGFLERTFDRPATGSSRVARFRGAIGVLMSVLHTSCSSSQPWHEVARA